MARSTSKIIENSELELILFKLDSMNDDVKEIKEDIKSLQSEVNILKDDFNFRKAVQKVFYAVVIAIGSAIGFIIDKLWRFL